MNVILMPVVITLLEGIIVHVILDMRAMALLETVTVSFEFINCCPRFYCHAMIMSFVFVNHTYIHAYIHTYIQHVCMYIAMAYMESRF